MTNFNLLINKGLLGVRTRDLWEQIHGVSCQTRYNAIGPENALTKSEA